MPLTREQEEDIQRRLAEIKARRAAEEQPAVRGPISRPKSKEAKVATETTTNGRTCPEHPGTKMHGRGKGWCPECSKSNSRPAPRPRAAKPEEEHPRRNGPKPDALPRPRPAPAATDDRAGDELGLLCDALEAVRKLGPKGRQALATVLDDYGN